MVTSKECIEKFGFPDIEMERKHMVVLKVPPYVRGKIKCIPSRIYMNKKMVKPFSQAIEYVIGRGLQTYIYSYNGCFNIRNKKGGKTKSLHSWGIAIDINSKGNGFGEKPIMPQQLVMCFKDAGFEWGGDWGMPNTDGMHFQLKNINNE